MLSEPGALIGDVMGGLLRDHTTSRKSRKKKLPGRHRLSLPDRPGSRMEVNTGWRAYGEILAGNAGGGQGTRALVC